jgi:Domain of unknown function (DUF4861)
MMKPPRLVPLLLAAALPWGAARAVENFTVTVTNPGAIARPAATVVIPFRQVEDRLPGLVFDQLLVKDAAGTVIPAEITAYRHVHKGPPVYNNLIFQHDFAAGEPKATFTVEVSPGPVPPFPAKVYVRYIPERYDDIAWENDRIAHRIYGPGLELPSATKDQMTSSGIDVWCKRVRYLVVNHWYHKGHDGLHTDTGEGLDMYDVGTYRGCGGTGVWDGRELHVSRNWRTEYVDANGPIRAVFDVGYAPWDAGDLDGIGNGIMASEHKRFVVDAGHNLDEIEDTFTFTGARRITRHPITIAIGLGRHPVAKTTLTRDPGGKWVSVWEEYPSPNDGNLGTGVVLGPGVKCAGFVTTPHDYLILVKVMSGQTIHYWAGAGWNRSGDFPTQASWLDYLRDWSRRLESPIQVALSPPAA